MAARSRRKRAATTKPMAVTRLPFSVAALEEHGVDEHGDETGDDENDPGGNAH
jgi:hypothetical protein